MNTFKRSIALALGAALLGAPTLHWAQAAPKAPSVQNITVTVDGSGYHPGIINVQGGRPVAMRFVSKGSGCSNEVVIPALKVKFRLRMGGSKLVRWTPRKGQSLTFACGMNMFHGKVLAK